MTSHGGALHDLTTLTLNLLCQLTLKDLERQIRSTEIENENFEKTYNRFISTCCYVNYHQSVLLYFNLNRILPTTYLGKIELSVRSVEFMPISQIYISFQIG